MTDGAHPAAPDRDALAEIEMRRPMVAANWKMNLFLKEALAYCDRLLPAVGEAAGVEGDNGAAVDVALFPAFPLLCNVGRLMEDSPVVLGAQDLHPEVKGAHTGDVSALQLIDVGCTWVLVGHSERRHDHCEQDALVAAKVEAAMRHGLSPMICVGETREEREAGKTLEVLRRQLTSAIPDDPGEFAVAYEPVWAIGSGESATPEIAQEAHAFLRETLAGFLPPDEAGWVRLLYGGSVKPENAADLAVQPDIDGFLVGGASLDPDSFLTIIRKVRSNRTA